MDPYSSNIPENDPYNIMGKTSTDNSSDGSSSYNPNVVYSTEDETNKDNKSIYSLEHEENIIIARDSEPWKELFKSGLENIEKSEILKENTHWNEIFQNLLDLKESKEKSQKLSAVAHDFVYCADTYGKIIISELHLPIEKKTIKPLDIGGIAGGLKFRIQDIMFKFVIDTEIRPGIWMYGDHERADGLAQKSANHEIKGLNHCMEAVNDIKGIIRFPLMSIIDYRGYRLLAISQLPIDKSTIVYGSCDAGKTVHNSDPIIENEMKKISEVLNLQGHVVGLGQTFIYGPGDIEVHKGYDGRYYMIDFARIFPPEYPLLVHNNRTSIGREIFYQMLRPEMVSRSPVPLSSDAFSGWQTSLFDTSTLNGDVIRASKILHQEIIQVAISNLNAKGEIDFSPTSNKIFEVQKSLNILHSQGINIRYMGILCNQSTNKSAKNLLMSEVVARVWKRIIRSKLRKIMDLTKRPSGEPYKELIGESFKLILGSGEEEIHFWSSMKTGQFKYIMSQVFPRSLSEEEKNENLDYRDCIDIKLVILRVIKLLNISINASSLDQFLSNDQSTQYVLGLQDIEEVGSTVKYPYIIDLSRGTHLLNKTKEILAGNQPNPKEIERWISLTGQSLYNASRQIPRAPRVVYKLLNAIHINSSFLSDPLEAVRLLIIGVINYSLHLSKLPGDSPKACGLVGLFHLQLATIYLAHSSLSQDFLDEVEDARNLLERAVKEDPNCLDEFIPQILPTSNKLIPVAFIKNSDNFYKRKVQQLLTLLYLLSKTKETSVLHQKFNTYFQDIIQIDNLEIINQAVLYCESPPLREFFNRFKNQLQSISIRKLIFTKEIAQSIVDMKNLVSFGLSDVQYEEDPNFHQFFKDLFENCPKLQSIIIISNKMINDSTFEGLEHHFDKIKGLAFCKTGITDKTLTNISSHLGSLKYLAIKNSREITDDSFCAILSKKPLIELRIDSVHLLTDKTAQSIIDHQKSLSILTFLNCSNITPECILSIPKHLKNLDTFEKPNCQLPLTYKLHLSAFAKLYSEPNSRTKQWCSLIKIFDS